MSWAVVVFNLSRKVKSVEEIDENILVPMGTGLPFLQMIQANFPFAAPEDKWCKIDTHYYSLEAYIGDAEEIVTNTIFHLYGEASIYALVELCKKNTWQAFDTASGCMLNLEKPEENGYSNHIAYVKQIMEN